MYFYDQYCLPVSAILFACYDSFAAYQDDIPAQSRPADIVLSGGECHRCWPLHRLAHFWLYGCRMSAARHQNHLCHHQVSLFYCSTTRPSRSIDYSTALPPGHPVV